MKQSSPRRKAAQATQLSRDARLCHLSKRETHVSTSLKILHLRRTSQVSQGHSLKNRRRASPSPSLQKVPFFTHSNRKTPPINRTSHFTSICPISCQRSAAEIVPRTAFHYSAFI